jgi:hypothetical protein
MNKEVAKLDTLFSQYIRMRAIKSVHGCERCLAYKEDWNKGLQCAHMFSRVKRSTRFDIDNAAGLCAGCHRYLDDNAYDKVEWFKHRLGEKEFEYLTARATRPTKIDMPMVTLFLKGKLEELKE